MLCHTVLCYAVQQGDAITFSWHFVGIGEEKCFHDGVELPDCESPMKVTANDVSSESTTHTFQVKFVDVCGNTKTADYKYTQKVSSSFFTPHWNSLTRLLAFRCLDGSGRTVFGRQQRHESARKLSRV